ncbi:sugar ABC transporter substrate-binding protein [Bacillus sp. FJAT-42376]|uniref:sugar-binding protein n=1 Tax=Bacillus sp. FJAT-42376 TaxID=2014076 RepID=UPI000F50BFC8|nr:sugar-binding protein [Bacillus sp. FJAT-42376]AZB44608.1 sugar ABC transporter substrate-binding protein [Bacillus sp. FJAT-42376]
MVYLKRFLYVTAILIFTAMAFMTIYFGKETFHVTEAVAGKKEARPSYHFVLIPEELDNEYWGLVHEGAQDAAKDHGVFLEYLGPKQANIDEHLKTIDMAIAGQVDGLMTQGIVDQKFTPLLNKAVEKGIPVVTIDTDAPNSEREAYIGTDNYYAGILAGKALIADTKGPQTVGVITGRFEASNQKLRVQGFLDAIKSEPRIKVAAKKESSITKAGAVKAAYDFFQEYPNLSALYGTSALDGIGIAQVTEYLNKKIYIIGFDTLPETLKYMEKGTIKATVVQYPYQMGYKGVETLLQLKKGEEPKSIQHTDTEVIRKGNLPLIPSKPEEGQQR